MEYEYILQFLSMDADEIIIGRYKKKRGCSAPLVKNYFI
jgi:hypothetical protein